MVSKLPKCLLCGAKCEIGPSTGSLFCPTSHCPFDAVPPALYRALAALIAKLRAPPQGKLLARGWVQARQLRWFHDKNRTDAGHFLLWSEFHDGSRFKQIEAEVREVVKGGGL